MMSRGRWALVGVIVIVGVVGFLLFRPDTLLTDVEADESLEEAFATTTTTIAQASSSTTLVDPATTTTTSVPAGPVQLSSGRFAGIDHSAEGTAAVYEQDGAHVLRFEDDTMIQNGPDLYVWLLAAESYEGGTPVDYIDLGTLKGTVGGQNYSLPEEFDPAVHRTVLVWCLRFSVPFAAAPLA
jgi:hypothetical protein